MNDKPHISQSQVNKYLKCGLQYKYHYVDKVKKPSNGYMLRGSAIDNSANVHFQNKIEGGKGISSSQFVDYAVNYHDENSKDVEFDIPKDKSRDTVAHLSGAYHEGFGMMTPSSVQLKLEQKYDDELDFIGYADMWFPDKSLVLDNKVWMRDKKTDPDLTKDIQMVKYAEILGAKQVGLSVVTYANGVPKVKLILQDITQKHIEVVRRRVDKAVEGIRKEVYIPPDQSVWWCSEKWCQHWDECDFGGVYT
tara:strand:- start:3794 stop:4543 length:750 start_codon:yes stop_codon:yes gene_type:complete